MLGHAYCEVIHDMQEWHMYTFWDFQHYGLPYVS
jgi:hypothetical protein